MLDMLDRLIVFFENLFNLGVNGLFKLGLHGHASASRITFRTNL